MLVQAKGNHTSDFRDADDYDVGVLKHPHHL